MRARPADGRRRPRRRPLGVEVAGHRAALPAPPPRPSSVKPPSRRDAGRAAGSAVAAHRALSGRGADRRAVGAGCAIRGRGDGELVAAGLPGARRTGACSCEFSVGDHERVWSRRPEAVPTITALFTAAPRVRDQRNGRQRTQSAASARPPTGTTRRCCRSSRTAYRGCSGPRSRASGGELMRVGFIGLGSQGGPMARGSSRAATRPRCGPDGRPVLEPYADTAAKPRRLPGRAGRRQ